VSAVPPEAHLVQAMWSWARYVLEPARALKAVGVPVVPPPVGEQPDDVPDPGLGPWFCLRQVGPVLLETPTEHDHLVVEFDRMGEVYDAFVRPFSEPIFAEAIAAMRAWVRPDARVLDAGCGAGRELRSMARLVPEGEVVGIDLAAGMVNAAHLAARSHGLDNTAFFQSDVGGLPDEFTGGFDIAYNCLAHHHYPDPPRAAREILRCLRPGGVYCVIDPGPAWFTKLSAPMANWADPGWIRFHTPEEFRELFIGAGFASTAWRELLPGFGLATAQKAHEPSAPPSV
jgi:SAM-dependent methyltransferase